METADGQVHAQKGWPTVILNTVSYGAERDDILAPFSIFLNLAGKSEVRVNQHSVLMGSDTFCFVNKGSFYNLTIPETGKTETFNIHFGDQLVSEVFKNQEWTSEHLLDDPFHYWEKCFEIPLHSQWINDDIQLLINEIRKDVATNQLSNDKEFELLGHLFDKLTKTTKERHKNSINSVKAQKKSTKNEVVRRLLIAADYIHSNFQEDLSLDQLSAISSLSKYHFLRSFKEVYDCTPIQYLGRVRMLKAKDLMSNTDTTIRQAAFSLGYNEPNSFTRLFHKTYGVSPTEFRSEI